MTHSSRLSRVIAGPFVVLLGVALPAQLRVIDFHPNSRIPAINYLLGQRLLFQALVVEAGGPMLGVGALSNAVDIYLGN